MVWMARASVCDERGARRNRIGERLNIASDVSHRRSQASRSGTSRTRTGGAPAGESGSRDSLAEPGMGGTVRIMEYRSGMGAVRGDGMGGNEELIYRTLRMVEGA